MLNLIRLSISCADNKYNLLSGLVEAKHEIFGKQEILTDKRLKKERSVIVARQHGTTDSDYYKIKIISRQKEARVALTDAEQRDFTSVHCEQKLLQLQMNPRFQRFRKQEYVAVTEQDGTTRWEHVPFNGGDARYPLSRIVDGVFQWMNQTFHGVGLKYAQHYMDEGCFRLNYAAGKSGEAFHRLLQCTFETLPVGLSNRVNTMSGASLKLAS
ncbi:hypothetical protein [Paenibacillus soyae]|uniref:Uncharacterized protein n=1 Tax=Paenibacillus soyae TaxID=2969249 RepID=A0A9X2MM20_9BACL|nr:hypothetical protein [Paenibacillus soyae]MCR2802589.1 hypothetical protein [Paenibacillus soyae]